MKENKYIDIIIIGFIFLILFTMPVLFVRINDQISWKHVVKIWQDNSLLIPIFAFNHWVLLPKLMQKRKYILYTLSVIGLILFATFLYKGIDLPMVSSRGINYNHPMPIPPYANMMSYAILIIGVDVGLYFSRMWQKNEKRTLDLERQNTKMELELLRNQVSPHFFMNTLNNIYALVDSDSLKAKSAVMKLSKLMRYLLYENNNGHVKLSKEFEFIESYIDLMRLRYTDEVIFNLDLPEKYDDIEIPPMLFISYIENAVKYGVSYQDRCEINIKYYITDKELHFTCSNPIHRNDETCLKGGIGLKNSKSRLDLIYGDKHRLDITETSGLYNVSLIIPIV